MAENTTDLIEIESEEFSSTATLETTETLSNEGIEQTTNPWDNTPEGVVFYRDIKDNGQIIGYTIGAELAYKLGMDLTKYLNPEDIQQSDKDYGYYLKDQCPMKSESDLQKDAYQAEIQTLKKQLSSTDYKAIKFAEGMLSEEEYAEVKELRQGWRDRINELEGLCGN